MPNAARDHEGRENLGQLGGLRMRLSHNAYFLAHEFIEFSEKIREALGMKNCDWQLKSKHFRHPLPAQARPKFTIHNFADMGKFHEKIMPKKHLSDHTIQ